MITSAIYFCVKLGLLQLYPTYISYKAIKVNDQKEFQSLLTFWIVSITYLSIEYFSDIFLFWVPFYTEIKLIILLWLILPQTQGTFVFYTRYLDPFLQQHEKEIDKTLLDIQAKLKETILLYGKHLVDYLKSSIFKLFKGHEKTIDQSQIEPKTIVSNEINNGYLISPYALLSSLVTARVQKQQEPIEPTPLKHTDSQESLQSYVSIKDANTSPQLTTRSSSTSWSDYLSTWVKKPKSE